MTNSRGLPDLIAEDAENALGDVSRRAPELPSLVPEGATNLREGVPSLGQNSDTHSRTRSSRISPLEGIGLSVVDEMASLFGKRDIGGKQLERWQNENPGLHFSSQLAGMMVPYLGWEMAAGKVALKGSTLAARSGDLARKVTTNPLGQGFIKQTAIFAPFEAVRAVSMASNGDGVDKIVRDVGLSLGVAGVAGSAIDGVKAFGRNSRLSSGTHWIAKELQYTPEEWKLSPAQTILRDLDGWRNANRGGVDFASDRWQDTEAFRHRLVNEIMQEGVGTAAAQRKSAFPKIAVGDVFSTQKIKGQAPRITFEIHDMFASNPGLRTRKLDKKSEAGGMISESYGPRTGPKGYAPFKTAFKEITGHEISATNITNIQYPRILQARAKTKTPVREWFDDNFTKIGKRSWITQEDGTGMFIMATKEKNSSRYALFKTDNPNIWNVSGAQWNQQLSNLYHVKLGVGGQPLLNTDKLFKPFVMDRSAALKHSNSAQIQLDLKANINPAAVTLAQSGELPAKGLRKAFGGEAVPWLGQLFRDTFAPGKFKFADPVANVIRTSWQAGYRISTARVTSRVFGEVRDELTLTQLMGNLAKVRKPSKLISALRVIEKSEKLTKDFIDHVYLDAPLDAAMASGVDDVVYQALKAMDDNALEEISLLQKTQAAAGMKIMTNLQQHMGLSRRWDDWIVDIKLDGKKISAVSGKTKAEAERLADQLKKEAIDQGYSLDTGTPYDYLSGRRTSNKDAVARLQDSDNHTRELLLMNSFDGTKSKELQQILARWQNKRMFQRTGVQGFNRSETIAEVLSDHMNGLMALSRQENTIANNMVFASDWLELTARNTDEAAKLGKEINLLTGGRPLMHNIEEAITKAASPVLGKDAGQKIASGLNSAMFVGTLGVANLAYATLNILSPLVQTLPHIAYLRHAPDSRVAHFYESMPALSANNRVLGDFNYLSPMKMAFAGTKRLHKPDKMMNEMLRRSTANNVIDQGMLDAAVGQDAVMGKIMTPFQKSSDAGELMDTMMKGMTYVADRSERFARIQSIAIATEVGEKLFKLSDPDKLFPFVEDFVSNTMYSYRTVDRSAAFQGPFGSVLGLFKTWLTNYVSWMGEYAGNIGHGGGTALLTSNIYAGMVGGMGATQVGQVGDFITRIAADKTMAEYMYSTFENEDADALLHGLPAFLGLSLQGNTALPGANAIRDIEMLSNVASWDMATAMGKVAGDGLEKWYLFGEAPWESRQWRNQLVRATQVKTLYRAQALTQENMIQSLSTGYPALQNPTVGDKVLYALGFAPIDLARGYDAYEAGMRVQDRNKTIRRKLALQYIEAQSQDGGDRNVAMEGFRNDLRSYPQFTWKSIMRSVDGISKSLGQSPAERRVRDKDARERLIPFE